MKYDFTTILDRYGKDAIAVDMPTDYLGNYGKVKREEGFDVIPMWVADMNFPVVPSIQKAIIDRVNSPTFGYYAPREEYFNSIIEWQKHFHGIDVRKEEIAYDNGVLGGLISACNVLLSKGDNILLHSPTYVGFTGVLHNNGYNMVHSPLIKKDDTWVMDYDDMEKKIVDNNIKVAVICNPHNPTGRVWTREELAKAMALFEKYGVYVISDEIWADLTLNGNKQIPTQSVSEYAREHTVALYAPSKTFNLAGLIGSYHIIYNKWLRERVAKEASLCHYNSMNVLSMYALIGAYGAEGREWVEELKEVLSGNVNYACDFIREKLPGVSVIKPEGTYMLFIDCEEYCKKNNVTLDDLFYKGWKYGVYWQDGRPFHGEYNIRINLALPLSRVKEAFDRLEKYVF
ncbi:MAG: aminotransferase class I/II-fold pyridoxal phosphate-dependent enzyme [Erysipelotrichaceae bacterium]|nr:aminotransferase class I/II-fold pyridoxal phosphate-dependent enzyme [Erysipelotrichaceae bacterium]MBQ2684800.1 aminotransferase class I/II-fold pyridoxal phosphate-dependent enzyme [Erysipelotrichaceae bacterium]MBR2600085.1 aminotransferase class I/II-fold pyridoxal phosphate-dependent enzyme [Erysipelotrichaceae bacterium]